MSLKRQIQCAEARIAYLYHIVEDPSTVDAEISRRLTCIREARETIAKHEKVIARIRSEVSNSDELLKQARVSLKALKAGNNAAQVKKWAVEILELQTALKELV